MSLAFFDDSNQESALDACASLGASSPGLTAELLGNLGAVIEGERTPEVFHVDATGQQTLYLEVARRGGNRGYMFFRYRASAPPQWLIVCMGAGTPDRAAARTAMQRLLRSVRG